MIKEDHFAHLKWSFEEFFIPILMACDDRDMADATKDWVSSQFDMNYVWLAQMNPNSRKKRTHKKSWNVSTFNMLKAKFIDTQVANIHDLSPQKSFLKTSKEKNG